MKMYNIDCLYDRRSSQFIPLREYFSLYIKKERNNKVNKVTGEDRVSVLKPLRGLFFCDCFQRRS